MHQRFFLAVAVALITACTPFQNPRPQAVLSTDPLVYLPEAQVESRTTSGEVETVRLRTYYARTLGQLQDELNRGLQSSQATRKCSELVGLGDRPYLHLRLAASPNLDLTLRITPLNGHWLLGHSLFQAELRRVPARFGLFGCPLD